MTSLEGRGYLVLIETAGNQNFIFATNKLRENVGASELTWRSGVELCLSALEHIGIQGLLPQSRDSFELRHNLLNQELNSPIENGEQAAEVILATSGKALVIFRDETDAKNFIAKVTLESLIEAPGIDLRGAVVPIRHQIWEAIKDVHQALEQVRADVPGPASRFLRNPLYDSCETSSWPANKIYKRTNRPIAEVSFKKQECATAAIARINGIANRFGTNYLFAKNLDQIDRLETTDWLAVVHADGNGLGQVFINFHRFCGAFEIGDDRLYIDKLRLFSVALDYCTESAFESALKKFDERCRRNFEINEENPLPIVPLILGGDDLTLVCDGRLAVQFAIDYLYAFEELTSDTELCERYVSKNVPQLDYGDVIPSVMGATKIEIFESEVDRVYASAGVASIKPHFPFHNAYDLASQLIGKAKDAVRNSANQRLPYSSIDFHILLDSSHAELSRIRRQLKVDDGKTLNTAKPYILQRKTSAAAQIEMKSQFFNRTTDDLEMLVKMILARQPVSGQDKNGGRILPSRVLHEIRDAMHVGNSETISRIRRIKHRYPALEKLVDKNASPYFEIEEESAAGETDKPARCTGLLDAMEVAEFWQLSPDDGRSYEESTNE